MSDEEVLATSKSYLLTTRLEAAADKLQKRMRSSFVDQRNLCSTCRHGTIMRRSSRNAVTVHCGVIGMFVPEDITECSDYKTITMLTLGQMQELAYLIDNKLDKRGGYI